MTYNHHCEVCGDAIHAHIQEAGEFTLEGDRVTEGKSQSDWNEWLKQIDDFDKEHESCDPGNLE
jgi:hypothetical protein